METNTKKIEKMLNASTNWSRAIAISSKIPPNTPVQAVLDLFADKIAGDRQILKKGIVAVPLGEYHKIGLAMIGWFLVEGSKSISQDRISNYQGVMMAFLESWEERAQSVFPKAPTNEQEWILMDLEKVEDAFKEMNTFSMKENAAFFAECYKRIDELQDRLEIIQVGAEGGGLEEDSAEKYSYIAEKYSYIDGEHKSESRRSCEACGADVMPMDRFCINCGKRQVGS